LIETSKIGPLWTISDSSFSRNSVMRADLLVGGRRLFQAMPRRP
jgi:hypothetical protein